jgi:hypothetical protein
MDTELSSQPRPTSGAFSIFVASFCAAIVLALGFGIVIEALVVAAAGLFELGQIFVWVGSAVVLLATLWLFVWSFVRSWHVERRLGAGLEVDEPSVSILANLRGTGQAVAKS